MFAVSMRATRQVTKRWAIKLKSPENAGELVQMNDWLSIYRVIIKMIRLNMSGGCLICFLFGMLYIKDLGNK